MLKATTAAILALPLAIAPLPSSAEPAGKHISEAAAADSALAAEFKRIMAPVSSSSAWVEFFGTTAPATLETVDGKAYSVYWGCKPHDCITESYVILYSQENRTISAGAFVRNDYDGPQLMKSDITWLGQADLDSARALGKYLY